jgi:predicted phosphodiesterase
LKIGIVSDVHCNHHALMRALGIIGDVDELICLGDSIYEYRFSNEVVRILKDRSAHTILGNHEEGFLAPQGIRARQPDWIDRSLLQWLAEQPKRLELSIGGKKLLVVLGAARDLRLPAQLAIGAVWRGGGGFCIVRPHPPSAGSPHWQSAGDQPGLGRRST